MLNDLVHDIDNTTRIEYQEIESRPLRLTRTKKLDGNLKEQEIKRRITSELQDMIPIVITRRVYVQCILPTISCGAETWNLS